jgi:hypothetical protein
MEVNCPTLCKIGSDGCPSPIISILRIPSQATKKVETRIRSNFLT